MPIVTIDDRQVEVEKGTGLVETARTNNRAGNPVGSSYLSEASALMPGSCASSSRPGITTSECWRFISSAASTDSRPSLS